MSATKRAAMAAVLFIASFAGATGALAVPNRTAVSVSGTDSGTCAPATPCRSIAYALTQTTPGGEMFVLTSGGYGPFTVTQSVSIIAPTGVIAAVSVGAGSGITINAGTEDRILLEGFLLDGLGTGMDGITFLSGHSLTLIGSKITGFVNVGIGFLPTVASDVTASLVVKNSMIYDNGANALLVRPSGTSNSNTISAVALLEGSSFSHGSVAFDGSYLTGTISAVVDNCVVRNVPAGGNGVTAMSTGANVDVQFLRSTMLALPSGFLASGTGARIAVGSSQVSNVGVVAATTGGGQVGTYGNNNMTFNGVLGPLSTIVPH